MTTELFIILWPVLSVIFARAALWLLLWLDRGIGQAGARSHYWRGGVVNVGECVGGMRCARNKLMDEIERVAIVGMKGCSARTEGRRGCLGWAKDQEAVVVGEQVWMVDVM